MLEAEAVCGRLLEYTFAVRNVVGANLQLLPVLFVACRLPLLSFGMVGGVTIANGLSCFDGLLALLGHGTTCCSRIGLLGHMRLQAANDLNSSIGDGHEGFDDGLLDFEIVLVNHGSVSLILLISQLLVRIVVQLGVSIGRRPCLQTLLLEDGELGPRQAFIDSRLG